MELREVARLAGSVGFQGSALVVMVAIIKAENRTLDPAARNPAPCGPGLNAIGLAQICNYPTRRPQALTDPRVNLEEAFKLFNTPKGFGHWVQYRNGEYKRFLAEAEAAVAGANSLEAVMDKAKELNPGMGDPTGLGGIVQSAITRTIQGLIPTGSWRRLGLYAAGAGLVIGGVALSLSDLAGEAVGAISKVIPAGKVAKVLPGG